MSGGRRLTRRDFIAGAAVAGAAAGAFTAAGALAAPGAFAAAGPFAAATPALGSVQATVRAATQIGAGAPVVSFHLDRPYVDLSGAAIPYVPPLGARSAEALARLSEADLFRLPL